MRYTVDYKSLHSVKLSCLKFDKKTTRILYPVLRPKKRLTASAAIKKLTEQY